MWSEFPPITFKGVCTNVRWVIKLLYFFIVFKINRLFSGIGTKNYKYDFFNDKMMACSNGISARVDSYTYSKNPLDIYDKKE